MCTDVKSFEKICLTGPQLEGDRRSKMFFNFVFKKFWKDVYGCENINEDRDHLFICIFLRWGGAEREGEGDS